MKRLLIGTLAALFIALPLYANTNTMDSNGAMKGDSMRSGDSAQKMEEHRTDVKKQSGIDDSQLQQAPADSMDSSSSVKKTEKTEKTDY